MFDELTLAVPTSNIQKDIASLASGNKFLPRLQVCGSSTEVVKEGKIPVGRFGLVRSKDKIDDLGIETNLLLLSARSKALDMSNREAILTYYDIHSDDFQRIIATSDSTQNSGCLYGPEILVWIPAVSTFATLFLSSASARYEYPSFVTLMDNGAGGFKVVPATLRIKYIKRTKHSWHSLDCNPCSQEINVLPDLEEFKTQMKNFHNPVASNVEKADESTNRER